MEISATEIDSVIAAAYDHIPYEGEAFPQTHPERLFTVATLMGMRPACPKDCRVLEIGCASGENLIPMAQQLPSSQFVGLDISQKQIEFAEESAKLTGTTNVKFIHQNIVDSIDSLGTFDYIIAHGVYSWVPQHVRRALLRVCGQALKTQGVAFISYNTNPGWSQLVSLRQMMLLHTENIQSLEAKVDSSLFLLDFLSKSAVGDSYKNWLQTVNASLARSKKSYIAHEHLEPVNEPCFFLEFIEQLDQHALQYVADASPNLDAETNFPFDVFLTLKRFAPNRLKRIQYLDFLTNRAFRQSIICRSEVSLSPNSDANAIRDMYIGLATASNEFNFDRDSQDQLLKQRSDLRNWGDLVVSVMSVLEKNRPEFFHFDKLKQLMPDAATEQLESVVLDLFSKNLITLRASKLRIPSGMPTYPKALPFSRLKCARGSLVPNTLHQTIQLQESERELLAMCDGTRTPDVLFAEMNSDKPTKIFETRETFDQALYRLSELMMFQEQS